MGIYRTSIPQAPLAAFVDAFWLYEDEAAPHAKEQRLPSGALDLVINLREDALGVYDRQNGARFQSFGTCVVSGAYSQFFVLDTASQTSLMGISFKPGGAAPFFPLPVNELCNTHVSLEALWGTLAGELRERLLASACPETRLRALEQFLLTRALRPLTREPMVTFALRALQASGQTRSIAQITEQIGYSSRYFNQVFSAAVGLTPKQFSRVRRFQEVLHLIEVSEQIVWSDIAANCGYFDQAHFIHDFRDFCGFTPGAYLAQRGEFRNHIPLPV